LTVVQGGNFLFYQTANLDESGNEVQCSELLPIEEDVTRLSTFPARRFANSFCVQLYPLCEFEAHRCRSHPMHAVLFTPIYAGDRGSGVLVIYPDGRQVAVRDRVTERIWQKVYADFAEGTLPLIPAEQREEQIAQIQERWLNSVPDELWLNPDARTYAAYFCSAAAAAEGDTTYYLLTGPLAEIGVPNWKQQSAKRIEMVDAALYGRFETSIVHLQGFCLKLYPQVEHITATRHIVPAHRALLWEQDGMQHALVVHEVLETWLHLHVREDDEQDISVAVLQDTPLRAQEGRRRFEHQRNELQDEQIAYADSYQPG
jgi:hypothetical protein